MSRAMLLLLLFAPAAGAAPPQADARLDALLAAHWKARGVTPAPVCDDATFLRRVWLDLAGCVPPSDKTAAFLEDSRADKRARLVEHLLASADFADHWGRSWAIRLTQSRPVRHETFDTRVLAEHLRDRLAAGLSYREIVAGLLTGEGLQDASGPANFLLKYDAKPERLVGAVGKLFMGTTLQCAECHDHVFAHWKRDDFRGLAAFFARVRAVSTENDEDGKRGILEAKKGEFRIPDLAAKPDKSGKQPMKNVVPRLPGRRAVDVVGNRRQALADWLTADDNPYFARTAVNHAWEHFFGVGLVRSLDDLDALKKEPNAWLLDELAGRFRAAGGDLRRLAGTIVLSRAYQLSSRGVTADADRAQQQRRAFACFPVRPLAVDPLYRSAARATGHTGEPAEKPAEEDLAADLAVSLLTEHPLTLQRALTLLNGDYVRDAARAAADRLVKQHGEKIGHEHVEALFVAALARRPTKAETRTILDLVREGEGTAGLEDAVWVLLSSAEFNTNH
jgi:hypothetical protein